MTSPVQSKGLIPPISRFTAIFTFDLKSSFILVANCSVSTSEVDRIIVDYFGLNTVSLLANTPPFAHNNQLFNSTMNHGKS